jgi:carbamoyltransferase
MLLVDRIQPKLQSQVPAVQHVDGTVRVQTVRPNVHPFFHEVISAFFALTGVPLVVNTSLNIHGEPLVCTPVDALRAFAAVSLDSIAIGSYLLTKKTPPLRQIFGGAVISGSQASVQ